MAVYVLSGRQTRVKWGVFKEPYIAYSNFLDNNGALARHTLIDDDWLEPNPYNSSGPPWRDLPYVRNVTVRTEAGVNELFAVGLDSYATMEETAIPFQEVTLDMILQPTVDVLDLFNAAIRWNVTSTDYAKQRINLHFVTVRLGIVGVPRIVSGQSGSELKDYGWIWDIYPGMISRVTARFTGGTFAEFSVTLQGGYIYITSFDLTDPSQRNTFESLIPPMSYPLSAGVINNFEGVVTFHPSVAGVVNFSHTGSPSTSQQPISIPTEQISPFSDSKFGMEIQEFSLTVDNRLTPIYPFLKSTFPNTTEGVQAWKTIRTYRGIFQGVSTVTGSLTALLPIPLPRGTLNQATAQEWAYTLNQQLTQTTLDVLVSFFPYAGTGAQSLPANPILQFAFYAVKFVNMGTGFTPQREITFSVDWRAIDMDVAVAH
ncbi:MAG: hypothetical protein QW687_00750 [Candidatus Hadarchaeales archaeon]